MTDQSKKDRDFWDKLDVIAKLAGATLIPLTVLLVGHFLQKNIDSKKDKEAKIQLFSQLTTQRESSESALRKDMFQHIIQSVVGKREKLELREQVLNLELLAQNFHDCLDLRSLFYDINRQIVESKEKGLVERLRRVAEEIRGRQFALLSEMGNTAYFEVELEKVGDQCYNKPLVLRRRTGEDYKEIVFSDLGKTLDGEEHKAKRKKIRVQALSKNSETCELEVRVQILTTDQNQPKRVKLEAAEVWAGFYDFPMIDNFRLKDDSRCAVLLNQFEKESAKIAVVCFPGHRASMREKAYYGEIVERLWSQNKSQD